MRALVAVASAGFLLSAGDNWKTKDFQEWTEADAQRVLENSPWSAKIGTSDSQGGRKPGDLIPTPRGGYGGGGGGGPMGGGGGGGGYGGGRQNTGDEQQQSRSRGPEVNVRWESALPVMQAHAKLKQGDAAKLDEAPKDYVIAVVWPSQPGGVQDAQNDLKAASRLEVKGKDPVPAEDTLVKSDASGRTMLFLFPRTTPITLEDKEVDFVTQVGRLKIEHKFKLKDMVYHNQLSL